MLKLLTPHVKFLKFIILIIFISFFNQTAFAEIKYIDTTAKGTGEAFEIAFKSIQQGCLKSKWCKCRK